MPQPWLVSVKRRTLEDVKEFLRPSQIHRLITAKIWPYKTQMARARRAPPIRAEVPLPREGPLAKFTVLVVEYLNLLPEDARLFEFKRRRAWQIVRHATGKWCHYFRSQGESWYGKIYDVFGLKEFVKVTSIETLGDYVQAPWRQYRNRLLGK